MRFLSPLVIILFMLSTACTTVPQETETADVPVEENPVYIQVAKRDAAIIGQKIWLNEGSGKVENLTAWNKGESFASLGIGHFIWYPAGQEGPFKETFPNLLAFLQQQGVALPTWLQNTPDCPWSTFEAFSADKNSVEMTRLRDLLRDTIPYQVQFLIQRLEAALPSMLNTLTDETARTQIRIQFYRVAETPAGVYALVDYVNFKGEGTALTERYQGQGWGLLQVLEQMANNSQHPVVEFADAATRVLERRVQNAPPERQESRWLSGWKNRLHTYRQAAQS